GKHASLAESRYRSWRAASQRSGETALGGSRPEQSNQLATGWTFTLIGAEPIPGGTAHDGGQGAQLDFSIAFPGQRIWMALGFADQAHQGDRGGNQESNPQGQDPWRGRCRALS